MDDQFEFVARGVAPDAVIVGGDLNTDPTQNRFMSERTHAIMADAAFQNPLLALPIEKRATIPAKGHYPDTTFDYLLFRGVEPHGEPVIRANGVSDHRPVTYRVTVP